MIFSCPVSIFHRAPIIAGPREPKLALGEISWNEKLTLPWISTFRPSYFEFSVFEPACHHPATLNVIGCRRLSPVPGCHNTRSSVRPAAWISYPPPAWIKVLDFFFTKDNVSLPLASTWCLRFTASPRTRMHTALPSRRFTLLRDGTAYGTC